RAVLLQRQLDDIDGAHDARAKTTRLGQYDLQAVFHRVLQHSCPLPIPASSRAHMPCDAFEVESGKRTPAKKLSRVAAILHLAAAVFAAVVKGWLQRRKVSHPAMPGRAADLLSAE